MLSLHDLSSDRSDNFFDASSVALKSGNDDSDESPDLESRLCFESLGSRSVTYPWELDFASQTSSEVLRFHPAFTSRYNFSASAAMLSHPCTSSNDASFAILGDGMTAILSTSSAFPQPTERVDASPRRCRFGYALVAVLILLCAGAHVFGLFVYFTPWYNRSIQVAIFRRFYSSFSGDGFDASVEAKRHAIAVVYLLVVGLVPTAIAASLWFTFSSQYDMRDVIHIPRFLRRKPVFLSKWKPVYIDATWSEIVVVVLLVATNGAIFIFSLLRANTELALPDDQIWRGVSKAFAFNALFNLVWLLLFLPKPCAWTVYIDFFGISDEAIAIKYRNWFGVLVLVSSLLHAFCMVVHFLLTGETSWRLFPGAHAIATDPKAGMVVFGEVALGVLLLLGAGVLLGDRIPRVVALTVSPVAMLIFVLTLCVHYPVTLGWILPTLALLLVQKAVAWAHSRYPVELLDMAPLPNGITRLVLRRSVDKMELSGSNFVAGQSVNIRLPQASWLQWQRCTIATSPLRHPGVFTIYIHPPVSSTAFNTPDATVARRIHGVAKVAYRAKKPPIVYVDGFYGPTHSSFFEKYRCLAFIGGGIGVVEMLSILEQLYHEAWLTACSTLDSKIARELRGDFDNTNVPRFDKQVWVLWSCDGVCLFKEFEDLFFRIRLLDPNEIHFKLRLFLTKIPLPNDVKYERMPSAGFICRDDDFTESRRGLLPDNESTNPCRRPRSRKPQNRSSLTCWSSRPFQQSASGAFCRTLIVALVLGALVPVTILVEWFALKTKAIGAFPFIQLLRNVGLLLLTGVVGAGVIALVNDSFLRFQRKRQEKLHRETTRHVHRSGLSTPSRGLKKLRSMTKMTNDDEELESGSLQSSDELKMVGPDVMERLMIYSMQPDIDKFLRTIGRAFPSFAGTIGVFASGNEELLELVETSTIACEASADEWSDVTADLEFHRLG